MGGGAARGEVGVGRVRDEGARMRPSGAAQAAWSGVGARTRKEGSVASWSGGVRVKESVRGKEETERPYVGVDQEAQENMLGFGKAREPPSLGARRTVDARSEAGGGGDGDGVWGGGGGARERSQSGARGRWGAGEERRQGIV